MNIKTWVLLTSLAVATILPFSSNGQQIINKAKKDLIETIDEKNNKINERIKNVVDYQKYTLFYINEIRKQNNLPPLKYDKKLEWLAIEQSKYLKENRPDRHSLTSGDHINWKNESPIDRIEKVRWERLDEMWTKKRTWENIVTLNLNSIKNAVDLRMLSKKWHREALLWPYTHIWIGYEKWSNFFIAVFARENPEYKK